MKGPGFSVIVPAHNEADLVGSAITSVLRQSRADWELIVIDDGSSDDTAEVARRFEREDPRIAVVTTANQGLSMARNTGIERARGRLISFLDSDDLLMPTYLAEMGAALDATPGAGFAYTDAWALDAASHRIRRATAMSPWNPPERPPEDPLEMIRLLLRDNFVFVAATVPRAVLDEVGGFDPALRSAEDYDLWLRILADGHRALRPPGILGIKRERPTAMSANHMKMITNQVTICRRVAADEGLPPDVRALADARIARLQRIADGLEGRDRARALVIALRRALSPIRSALEPGRRWRRRPPAEVRAAFPDLESL
jgi:glycosyltransferase involved in cell wall biosynthesis